MSEKLIWWDGKQTPDNCVHPSTAYKQGCGDATQPAFLSKAVVRLIENRSADQKKIRQFVANLLYGFRTAVNVMVSSNVDLLSFNVWDDDVRLFAHRVTMTCGDNKGYAWIITTK